MNQETKDHSLFGGSVKLAFLLVVLVSVLAVRNYAQLDPAFGTGGITVTNVLSADSALETFVLPNDKIFILNESRINGQPNRYSFVRHNSDGTIDLTYGVNGIIQLSIPTISTAVGINAGTRQSDGKFLLVGFDAGNGFIGRFNEDGTLDTTFATNGIHRPNVDFNSIEELWDVNVLPDGKILTVGKSNANKLFFVRYFSNGLLDDSFNSEGFILHNLPNPNINKMLMQSTGKIVIFGSDGNQNLVKRYNSDGTPDASFLNISILNFNTLERQIHLLPDDKMIIASNIQKTESLERQSLDVKVTKFNSNGTIDSSFGSNGEMSFDITTTFQDRVFAVNAQPDGQIVVGCSTTILPNRTTMEGPMLSLARISADGTLNGKFMLTKSDVLGRGTIDILPDGKILTIFKTLGPSLTTDLLLTRSLGVPLKTYNFKGVPFDFLRPNSNGYQPDGISDPAVFRSGESKWYMYPFVPEFGYNVFGLTNDIPVPSDYLSDLGSEMAVFRPSNGTWYIAKSFYNSGQNFLAVQWGLNGDVPVPGDYDNDSKSDIAVFRPSNGGWYIRNSNDNSVRILQWGLNGDKPVGGDYDGDGKADVAVWRPSDGVWYILRSSDGQPSFTYFGLAGDIPVQEDYDGDGKTDVAVWRPSTGVWYILRSSDGGFSALQWGLPADYAVPADYDGDKKTDIAVWRPSQGRWYVFRSSDSALGLFYWGTNGDVIPQRRQ